MLPWFLYSCESATVTSENFVRSVLYWQIFPSTKYKTKNSNRQSLAVFVQDSVVSDMVAYANRRTSVILSKDKEYVFFSVLVNFVQSYLSIYDSKCIYGKIKVWLMTYLWFRNHGGIDYQWWALTFLPFALLIAAAPTHSYWILVFVTCTCFEIELIFPL